jgi:hypothetical protein
MEENLETHYKDIAFNEPSHVYGDASLSVSGRLCTLAGSAVGLPFTRDAAGRLAFKSIES